MKKFITVSTLLVLFSVSAFSQINKNWDGTKPEVYKGSKNFIFYYSPFVSQQLGGAFAGSYSNYIDSNNASVSQMFGAGFQYYVTDNISLGGGISFGTSTEEPKWTGAAKKYSATSLGFSIDGNYHFKALYGVSPYLGLNVHYGTNSSKNEETYGIVTTTVEKKGNQMGLGVNFGFDWYFAPGISLGGKYLLGAEFNGAPEATVTTSSTPYVSTYTGPKVTNMGTGLASIILNVHF